MRNLLPLAITIVISLWAFLVLLPGFLALRFYLFKMGPIPGMAGSAVEMAFWLIPLFIATIIGQRVYLWLLSVAKRSVPTDNPDASPSQEDRSDNQG